MDLQNNQVAVVVTETDPENDGYTAEIFDPQKGEDGAPSDMGRICQALLYVLFNKPAVLHEAYEEMLAAYTARVQKMEKEKSGAIDVETKRKLSVVNGGKADG